jgi:hypothetical protein
MHIAYWINRSRCDSRNHACALGPEGFDVIICTCAVGFPFLKGPFLSLEESAFIIGHTLAVNGGFTAR